MLDHLWQYLSLMFAPRIVTVVSALIVNIGCSYLKSVRTGLFCGILVFASCLVLVVNLGPSACVSAG